MNSSGTNRRFLADYGNFPNWHPSGDHILYQTRAVTQQGQVIGDSLWVFNPNSNAKSFLTFLGGQNYDNRYPRYSPDGAKIVFQSQAEGEYPQIWVMDANGNNLQKLTTDGGFTPSWVDNNTIAYIGFKPRGANLEEYLKNHGTLWVMNSDGSNKKQLTFFYGEVVDQIQ